MTSKITNSIELVLGVITILSTTISGQVIFDILIAIVSYTSARLFYHYYGNHIKASIMRFKRWLKWFKI
ncbi:MAG: hypothetical protein HRT87_06410 [Legionellales bacterium]|nr:hypothetical protein [Legionellales bacterium]